MASKVHIPAGNPPVLWYCKKMEGVVAAVPLFRCSASIQYLIRYRLPSPPGLVVCDRFWDFWSISCPLPVCWILISMAWESGGGYESSEAPMADSLIRFPVRITSLGIQKSSFCWMISSAVTLFIMLFTSSMGNWT